MEYFRNYYQNIPKAAENENGVVLDVHRFDSFRAYVDYAARRLGFHGGSCNDASLRLDRTGWRGEGKDMLACVELARSGWERGRESISTFAQRITGVVGQNMIDDQPYWDHCGVEVDMDRYLTGEPECMIDYREEITEGRGKVLTVAFSFDLPGFVEAEAVLLRGAMIAGLVDCLEQTGYAVELLAVSTNHQIMETQVVIKGAGEALDLDTLAFATGHAGMLRRFEFAHYEMQTGQDRAKLEVHLRYGSPMGMGKRVKADLFIPSVNDFSKKIWDKPNREEKAIEWIVEALKEFGVGVEVKV